ncbi:MAG: hypothetical protein H7X97_08085 [Opitutaceae bacterium]|nr:hypothetical protein [Verrucomicrobiales bacterium]
MKQNLVRLVVIGAALMLATRADRVGAATATYRTVDIYQTNLTSRFITNAIEVRAPQNVFVDEFRTNWIHRTHTNVIRVVETNWTTKMLTNVVAVNQFKTNVLDRYQTNWTTVNVTNSTLLTLTNWETVVVTRTNWIHQPMTNFIEVSKSFATAVLVPEQVTRPEPKPEPLPVTAEPVADNLVLETVKTVRPFDNQGMEILFKVRLSSSTTATVENPQWRVEREDGAVFFAAQTQEFSRRLPPGRYKIEVKGRRDARGPMLNLQSVMIVTRDTVAQR